MEWVTEAIRSASKTGLLPFPIHELNVVRAMLRIRRELIYEPGEHNTIVASESGLRNADPQVTRAPGLYAFWSSKPLLDTALRGVPTVLYRNATMYLHYIGRRKHIRDRLRTYLVTREGMLRQSLAAILFSSLIFNIDQVNENQYHAVGRGVQRIDAWMGNHCIFTYCTIQGDEDIKYCEKALIRHFHPALNSEHNDMWGHAVSVARMAAKRHFGFNDVG